MYTVHCTILYCTLFCCTLCIVLANTASPPWLCAVLLYTVYCTLYCNVYCTVHCTSEYSESTMAVAYFCQISSKSILIILSYTVLKLVHFWDSIQQYSSESIMMSDILIHCSVGKRQSITVFVTESCEWWLLSCKPWVKVTRHHTLCSLDAFQPNTILLTFYYS